MCTLQPETEVQNKGEASVSEHLLEGKANENINKESKGTEKDIKKSMKERLWTEKNLDSLLQKLPRRVSRELIDQLTVEFCNLNSKANRKKLARALFTVPRTSVELLPYYS